VDVECEPSRKPYALQHPEYCDQYYLCDDNERIDLLCDDGLVFDPKKEQCDLPYAVNCGNRTKLHEPEPTPHCPRKNGMYPVEGSCDQFYHCTEGIAGLIKCPTGVLFEPSVGACVHADQTKRKDCSASDILEFDCPSFGLDTPRFGDHDRLPHPTSCRHFYMCLLSGLPRLGGCSLGLVFNPKTGRCDEPAKVPGCEDFYGDEDGEEFDEQNDPSATPPLSPSKKKKKVEEKVIEEEETTKSVQTQVSSVRHRFLRPRTEVKTDQVPVDEEDSEEELS